MLIYFTGQKENYMICALILKLNSQLLNFGTAWYGPIEMDINVNLFILNNIFMVSWFSFG